MYTFNGHSSSVYSIIELKTGEIASGSYDKTIKIWDKQGKCLYTFNGHSSGVISIIELKTGEIASGS